MFNGFAQMNSGPLPQRAKRMRESPMWSRISPAKIPSYIWFSLNVLNLGQCGPRGFNSFILYFLALENTDLLMVSFNLILA